MKISNEIPRALGMLLICLVYSCVCFSKTKNLSHAIIAPYAFEQCADVVFIGEQKKTFNPDSVKFGSVVAMHGSDVPYFFKHYNSKIMHPYIILTFGEYRDAFQESYIVYLENEKIISWFGVHPFPFTHPKFIPLPLGIKIKTHNAQKIKKKDRLFTRLRNRSKKKLVYLNFALNNPQRKLVRNLLKDSPFCFVSDRLKNKGRLSFYAYLKEMASCVFTVSPPGNGPDSYRTWESIMVGSIPIVEHSQLDQLSIIEDKGENPLGIVIEPSLPEGSEKSLSEVSEHPLVDEQNDSSINDMEMGIDMDS